MTHTEIDRIRKLALSGMSGTKIAAKIGRNRDTVSAAIRQLRAIGKLPPKARLIDTVPSRLVNLIRANCRNGVVHTTLAQQLNCTVEQIRIVRRYDKSVRVTAAERECAARAVAEPEPEVEPDLLSIALKKHLPPLTSLPDRAAALGIPVLVRRAAA